MMRTGFHRARGLALLEGGGNVTGILPSHMVTDEITCLRVLPDLTDYP
jgi:hypothetical protein